MVDDLMRNASIVLQDVVVLDTLGNRDLLCDGKNLDELVVGNVVQLCAVELRDDQLIGRI